MKNGPWSLIPLQVLDKGVERLAPTNALVYSIVEPMTKTKSFVSKTLRKTAEIGSHLVGIRQNVLKVSYDHFWTIAPHHLSN